METINIINTTYQPKTIEQELDEFREKHMLAASEDGFICGFRELIFRLITERIRNRDPMYYIPRHVPYEIHSLTDEQILAGISVELTDPMNTGAKQATIKCTILEFLMVVEKFSQLMRAQYCNSYFCGSGV